MHIETIESSSLAIPFKVSFRHASAERHATQSLWVEVRSAKDFVGYGEGCPREYVTGESLASGHAYVRKHRGDWAEWIGDLDSLSDYVASARHDIDTNPAAWSAVELGLLDLLGKEEGLPLEGLLGVPSLGGRLRYTAVLGDCAPAAFEAQLAHYLKAGFGQFKVKISGDYQRDLAKTRALLEASVDPGSVRADANNVFRSSAEAIAYFSALDYPFFAIEEPLAPGDYDGMRAIALALGARIILDESVARAEQLEHLRGDPQRWIANLRISKMGGVLRSIRFVRAARDLGVRLVVGAHVGETSVLTRAGITVANLARDILVGQEGAFGTHLLERDVVDPPIMFGPGGVLAVNGSFRAPGLGLAISPQPKLRDDLLHDVVRR